MSEESDRENEEIADIAVPADLHFCLAPKKCQKMKYSFQDRMVSDSTVTLPSHMASAVQCLISKIEKLEAQIYPSSAHLLNKSYLLVSALKLDFLAVVYASISFFRITEYHPSAVLNQDVLLLLFGSSISGAYVSNKLRMM